MHVRARIGRGLLRLAGICAVALLPACAAPPAGPERAAYAADAAQAHHDLFFVPGGAELAAGEPARLQGFLSSLLLRPEDDIVLTYAPSGSDRLDRRRLAAAHRALARTPARLRIAAAPGFSRAAPRPDAALVQVLRYDTLVVLCPGGLARGDAAYPAALPPIGCANAANRAVMAASLRDLTAPGGLRPVDTTPAAAAVRRYRLGPLPAAPLAGLSAE